NPSQTNLIITFTGYSINGNSVGVNNVGVVYGGASNCANRVMTCDDECEGATPANSVCVPAGASLSFWVFSNSDGASPQGGQSIPWQWLDPSADCAVILANAATSDVSPPNDAC